MSGSALAHAGRLERADTRDVSDLGVLRSGGGRSGHGRRVRGVGGDLHQTALGPRSWRGRTSPWRRRGAAVVQVAGDAIAARNLGVEP
ncbi:MAG: hypothetical protein ACLSVD_02885 [Eggerthellaceae bacterium]